MSAGAQDSGYHRDTANPCLALQNVTPLLFYMAINGFAKEVLEDIKSDYRALGARMKSVGGIFFDTLKKAKMLE